MIRRQFLLLTLLLAVVVLSVVLITFKFPSSFWLQLWTTLLASLIVASPLIVYCNPPGDRARIAASLGPMWCYAFLVFGPFHSELQRELFTTKALAVIYSWSFSNSSSAGSVNSKGPQDSVGFGPFVYDEKYQEVLQSGHCIFAIAIWVLPLLFLTRMPATQES